MNESMSGVEKCFQNFPVFFKHDDTVHERVFGKIHHCS